MADKALDALKQACRQQIDWLRTHAKNYESSHTQHIESSGDKNQDRSAEIAEEFHHQANNLQAVMEAYDRLSAKASQT